MFPSESLKGPERVHRHSQACPGPKPWPAPLCVFPSAVGSQLGPTRPPPCSAELRSGPATTGGPMSREPRGGFSPPFLRFCPDSKIIAGTLRRGAVTGNLPELGWSAPRHCGHVGVLFSPVDRPQLTWPLRLKPRSPESLPRCGSGRRATRPASSPEHSPAAVLGARGQLLPPHALAVHAGAPAI